MNPSDFKERKGMIRLPNGPQFIQGAGFVLGFVFVLILAFIIVCLLNGELLWALLLSAADIALLSYILNIQGVEIDFSNQRVIEYRMFLWQKMGEWEYLPYFTEIRLELSQISINNLRTSPHPQDHYNYYDVFLVNPDNNRKILLREFERYENALDFGEKFSRILQIKYTNNIRFQTRSHPGFRGFSEI
jgi:hypothetical protein